MDGDQKPPLTAEFLPQVRGCGRTRAVPWRALALSRSPPPGPSAGQLAHGVLCRRISSGAHTAVLIRHTGVAFETGRAGRFPGKGWGGKGHPQLLPESSSLSTGTNSRGNPPPQQAQCWGARRPLASPADPTARTRASTRCPAPQLDAVPGEGATGDGGCRRRWPGQLRGFGFPLIR